MKGEIRKNQKLRGKEKKDGELKGKENKWVRMENMSFTQTQILCMFIGSGNDI